MLLEKLIFEFYFGLKNQKMITPEGGMGQAVRLQVHLSSSQYAFLIPKNALLFQEILFYFPELPFYFPEMPFYFSKISYCFPELPFSFPEMASYFLCLFVCTFCYLSSFSKKMFYQLIVSSPRPEATTESVL